jgi:hypothetical protein
MIKAGELFVGLRMTAVAVHDLGSDSLATMLLEQALQPSHLSGHLDRVNIGCCLEVVAATAALAASESR